MSGYHSAHASLANAVLQHPALGAFVEGCACRYSARTVLGVRIAAESRVRRHCCRGGGRAMTRCNTAPRASRCRMRLPRCAALAAAAAALSLLIGRRAAVRRSGSAGRELARRLREIRLPRTLLALLDRRHAGALRRRTARVAAQSIRRAGPARCVERRRVRRGARFLLRARRRRLVVLPTGAVAGSITALAALYALARTPRRLSHDHARRHRHQRVHGSAHFARAELRAESVCRARNSVLDARIARRPQPRLMSWLAAAADGARLASRDRRRRAASMRSRSARRRPRA